MNPPAPYRIRSTEIWDLARDDYLAGDAARVVCRRYDLGLSAFRLRARKEGWRREDQADPEPYDPVAELAAVQDMDLSRMAWSARRRLQMAVMDGEAADALRWLALFETLSAMAAQEAPSPSTSSGESANLHLLHPVFSSPGSETDRSAP